jgi:hypothetical protein
MGGAPSHKKMSRAKTLLAFHQILLRAALKRDSKTEALYCALTSPPETQAVRACRR